MKVKSAPPTRGKRLMVHSGWKDWLGPGTANNSLSLPQRQQKDLPFERLALSSVAPNQWLVDHAVHVLVSKYDPALDAISVRLKELIETSLSPDELLLQQGLISLMAPPLGPDEPTDEDKVQKPGYGFME